MIKNFAKFSCVLNIVEVSISSLSESDRGHLFVRVAMIADFMFQQLCASPALGPTRGRYMEMDLLFPTPKLHYCHTRRSRFQRISNYFTTIYGILEHG